MLLPATVDLYFIGSIPIFIYQLLLVFVAVVCHRNTLINFLTIFKVTSLHSTSFTFGVDHLIVFETNQIILSHIIDSVGWHPFLVLPLPRLTIYLIRTWQFAMATVRAYLFPQSRQKLLKVEKIDKALSWTGVASSHALILNWHSRPLDHPGTHKYSLLTV